MAYDINKAKMILKILKEEYGITSEKELDEAIKRQGFIDIAPFCTPPKSVSQPPPIPNNENALHLGHFNKFISICFQFWHSYHFLAVALSLWDFSSFRTER